MSISKKSTLKNPTITESKDLFPAFKHLANNNPALISITAVLIALFAAIQISIIHRYGVNIQVHDDLSQVVLIDKIKSHTLSFMDLWRQHNEHRMLFPKLWFILSYHMIGLRNVALGYQSYALAIVCSIIVWRISMISFKGIGRYIVTILSAALLLSTGQVSTWLYGFQIQWLITITAIFAMLLVLIGSQQPIVKTVIAAIFLTIATYSLASGLLYWGLIFLAMVITYRQWGRKAICTWAGIGAVVIFFYFYGWHPLFQGDASYWKHHPVIFIRYILAYLGGPLNSDGGLIVAQLMGFIGLLIIVCNAAAAWFMRKREDLQHNEHLLLPWISLILFGFANAAITAIGRCSMGIDQALSDRYFTMSNLFWIGIVGLTTYTLTILLASPKGNVKTVGFVLSLIAFVAFFSNFVQAGLVGYYVTQRESTTLKMLLFGQYHTENAPQWLINQEAPDTPGFKMLIGKLKAWKEGIYRDPQKAELLDHWISGRHKMYQNDYAGAISDIKTAADGLPEIPFIHADLAKCYKYTGQQDLSNKEMEQAIAYDARYADAPPANSLFYVNAFCHYVGSDGK